MARKSVGPWIEGAFFFNEGKGLVEKMGTFSGKLENVERGHSKNLGRQGEAL